MLQKKKKIVVFLQALLHQDHDAFNFIPFCNAIVWLADYKHYVTKYEKKQSISTWLDDCQREREKKNIIILSGKSVRGFDINKIVFIFKYLYFIAVKRSWDNKINETKNNYLLNEQLPTRRCFTDSYSKRNAHDSEWCNTRHHCTNASDAAVAAAWSIILISIFVFFLRDSPQSFIQPQQKIKTIRPIVIHFNYYSVIYSQTNTKI